MFSRKAVISSHTPQDSPVNQKRPVSLLTRLVQQYPDGVNNPFLEYSKFDGTVSCDVFVYVILNHGIINLLLYDIYYYHNYYLGGENLHTVLLRENRKKGNGMLKNTIQLVPSVLVE